MYNLSGFPSDFSVYWRLLKIYIIGSQRYECWIKNSAVCGCIISKCSPRFEKAPCFSRTGQPPCQPRARRLFIPSHALVVLRTVTGSLWALWMAKEKREEMCRAVLMWSVGPVLEGWNSLFTKDTAWGSSKLFFTSTFLFYPNYPGFVVYIPAPAVSGVGGCALDGLLVPSGISISCPCPAPCWGCAPSSVSLAQVDKLYPCSAQHPVSITACVEFLRRV